MIRVEVAGCIASGKTTLVKALADYAVHGIHEDHRVNPFWRAFYTDPLKYAFETEIGFLLQHYHFVKTAEIGSREVAIMDHSFELDMAYAQVGLKGKRKRIFEDIYQEINEEIGVPRAVVFVDCRPQEALRRIQSRGRPFESSISLEFLTLLRGELKRRATSVSGNVQIVTIDSESVDFRQRGVWQESLIGRLGINERL